MRTPFRGSAVVAACLSMTLGNAIAADPTPRSGSATLSPAIAALERSIAAGDRAAEARFWAAVQREGSPLIEDDGAGANSILLTFLWRGDATTRNVVVLNAPITSPRPADSQLTRLETTDVWFRTYRVPSDIRFPYDLSVNDDLTPFDQVTDWRARTSTFHLDPLNARVFQSGSIGRKQSYFEGPRARRDPWLEPRADIAHGNVEQTTIASTLMANQRRLWVYTPAGFDARAQSAVPLLVVFDGEEYVSGVPVPTILDNLIAARRIRPMVALFVGNVPGRRDAELAANERFAEFIATELLAWARARYPISTSARDRIIAGSSLGGLQAAFVAKRHPDVFGNVLSQSGAFSFSAPDDAEPELLARAFSVEPRQDTRFYLQAGSFEGGQPVKGVDMLVGNRHLRDVLRARGYTVWYEEYAGGHSDLNWREGFATALLALASE